MLAAWYEKKGKAKEVYNISQLKDPEPKPNEVRKCIEEVILVSV